MKTIHTIILLLFITVSMQSQSKSFIKRIEKLNKYASLYEKINAYDEFTKFSDLKLSKKDTKEVKSNELEVYQTKNKDSIKTFALIDFFQDKMETLIDEITHHKDFTQYDITELIDFETIHIAKSDDNKLFNFTFDEKTGGSYRSQISIMYYVSDNEKEIDYDLFNIDGYYDIKTIYTTEGTKYILIGAVQGCTLCFEEHISLVQFKNNAFEIDFEYGINYRDGETANLTYNEINQTITATYVTDDLTYECYCENELDTNPDSAYNSDLKEENLKPKKCSCTFIFNGTTFETQKASFEMVRN